CARYAEGSSFLDSW
nr:immunoglobulin heavy chain junction region [Macaca mulatta]